MKIIVKVKNNITIVRKQPNNSASILSTLNKSNTEQYTATKMYKGWYYLNAVYGWIYNNDLMVTQIIEPYNPATDSYSYETEIDDSSTEASAYDGDAVITAINNAQNKVINAIKIVYQDGETSINMQTLIKSLLNSLNDMNGAIEIVNNIQAIPVITNDNGIGEVAYINSDKEVVWGRLSYTNLSDLPEDTVKLSEF